MKKWEVVWSTCYERGTVHRLDALTTELRRTRSELLGHTAISRKVVGKKCTRQSRKVLWDMFNTPSLTLNLLLLLSFSTRTHTSVASSNILSNFFEKQWTQNYHNSFRGCRVHFIWQPFSKWPYTKFMWWHVSCVLLESAMSKSLCVWYIKKDGKLFSSAKKWKLMWSICREHRTKKKSECPTISKRIPCSF